MSNTPFLKEVPKEQDNRIHELGNQRPSRQEAMEAVKTLIRWAGDNPDREGLKETPYRVTKAYEEFFSGYSLDPEEILTKTFSETNGYEDVVTLSDIRLESFCEHHMTPIVGKVHIAYVPDKKVIGISKVARIVDVFSKRLQLQERLTSEIAESINSILKPKGVAVYVKAQHLCITTRGAHKQDTSMVTTHMLGVFRERASLRDSFFNMIERR